LLDESKDTSVKVTSGELNPMFDVPSARVLNVYEIR